MQKEILPTFKQYKKLNWALSLSQKFQLDVKNTSVMQALDKFAPIQNVAVLCAHITKRNKKINELCAQLKNQNKKIRKLNFEIRQKETFQNHFANQTILNIKNIYISNGFDPDAAGEKAGEHFRRIRQAADDLTNLPF